MGILATAITGINAAQMALLTTEHNISNANTPGYSRQSTLQTSVNPVFTGAGFIGQGTRVATIERQYSAFLTNQVNQAQSSASEMSAYQGQIDLINNMLADPNTGLSPAVQDFFSGVQQVAADPASLPARQAVVSSAQALAARFQGIQSRFDEIYNGVNSQISTTVDAINSAARQIGDLNQRIEIAGAASQQPANDLLDQRDQAIADLNKLIRVQVVTDTNGAFNLFVGNGQQLVVGSTVSELGAQPSAADPSRTIVGLNASSGFIALSAAALTGGELGGLLRFRNESLGPISNGLGQVAASLALTFNAQHALGQDLLGQVAGSSGFAAGFFTSPSPNVIANSANTSGAAVAASFVPPSLGANGFSTDLTASDYQLVANGGGNFTLTRLSDNKVWGPAALGSATAPFANGTLNSILSNASDPGYDPQGFTLTLSAAPLANESFLIQPTRTAASTFALNGSIANDPRLIAAAAPIRGRSAATNTGSGQITAMSVGPNYVAPTGATPITLSFAAPASPANPAFPNGSLSGFQVGTKVTLANAGALNGTFTITAPTDQVPYQTGASITIDDDGAAAGVPANALHLQIDGLPTAGDSFVIERNAQGVADGRNMLKLGQLQIQNTMSGATATYQSSYARLVSDVGNKAREISVTGDAQQKLVEQASAARDAESGVNLDEEAANLIRFQQAYQASAKSLDIASRLFDEILALGR